MKRMYAFTLQKFKQHYHNQMETQFTILVKFNYAMHFTQPTLQPNSKIMLETLLLLHSHKETL